MKKPSASEKQVRARLITLDSRFPAPSRVKAPIDFLISSMRQDAANHGNVCETSGMGANMPAPNEQSSQPVQKA